MHQDKDNNLLDQVAGVWGRRTGREHTREDAREIVENLCGFVELLADWDRRDRAKHKPGPAPVKPRAERKREDSRGISP